MAKKITQKQLKHDEFVDAAFDFGHWMEKHWVAVASSVGLIIVLVIGFVLWNGWSAQRDERVREELAQVIDRYEALEEAGFADEAALTEIYESFDELAGNARGVRRTARFYRGATLYHLDRREEARADLERVARDAGADDILGATSQLLLARLEAADGRTDEAAAWLKDLAEAPDAAVPPEQALLELGRLYDRAGRVDEAREQWQRIVDEHPSTGAAAEARTLIR
jgi:tetratricopeptide (TPR) repeat protein